MSSKQTTDGDMDFIQMRKRAKEVEEFADSLRRKGHTCIGMLESFPPQIVWCEKERCSGRK